MLGLLLGPLVALAVLAPVFAVIERLRPVHGHRSWRAWRVDLLWLWTAPLRRELNRGLTLALLLPLIAPLVWWFGGPPRGFGPLATLPWVVQAALLLLAADFVGYWVHRLFHRPGWLWRIHAVHHSSEHLDWLASVRVHPLNDAIGSALRAVPLLALGFDPTTLVGVTPVITAYALVLHANVDWRFGPLRYVFASPGFHRWHHAAEVDGQGVNFGGLLVVWDLAFGTWYLPDRPPARVGVDDLQVPTSFFGQLAFPFRRAAQPPR